MSDLLVKNTVAQAVAIITAAIIGLIAVALVMMRVDNYMKIKAIDDCAKISKFEKMDNTTGIRVAYPVVEVYKSCLKDKGVK